MSCCEPENDLTLALMMAGASLAVTAGVWYHVITEWPSIDLLHRLGLTGLSAVASVGSSLGVAWFVYGVTAWWKQYKAYRARRRSSRCDTQS
jgi:hypothetical protein